MNNCIQKLLSTRVVAVLPVMLLLLLTACNTAAEQPAAASNSEFVIELSEAGLTAPEQLPAGLVSIIFKNTGQAPHLPEIARLNEGVALDDVVAAAGGEDPMAALALVQLLGGTQLMPGASQKMVYDLQAGTHLVLDFATEGPPATAAFEATGDSGLTAAPQADVNVELDDFAFIMPDQIEAGPQTWQIVNKGNQWHELAVVKLDEGMTMDDLMAKMHQEAQSDGPPALDFAAFLAPLNQGEQTWITFDLQPGQYAVFCSLPDLLGGMEKTHADHGMIRQLVVTE